MTKKKNRHDLSREIPPDVKRAVRQRDGFGCVVCGSALVTYEHFAPEFAHAKKHDVDGICLLCPNHHYGKGKFVSRKAIERAKAKSKSIAQGYAAGVLDVGDSFPGITVGSVTGKGCSVLLHVDGVDVVSISSPEEEGAPYTVNACILDFGGNKVLEIVENELRAYTSNWDCELIGGALTIRNAPRSIGLRARLEPGIGMRLEEFAVRHGSVDVWAKGGFVYAVLGDCAFELADIEIERVGGTVLYVTGNEIVVGKAPVGHPSFASGSLGTLRAYPRGHPRFDELAAEAARR